MDELDDVKYEENEGSFPETDQEVKMNLDFSDYLKCNEPFDSYIYKRYSIDKDDQQQQTALFHNFLVQHAIQQLDQIELITPNMILFKKVFEKYLLSSNVKYDWIKKEVSFEGKVDVEDFNRLDRLLRETKDQGDIYKDYKSLFIRYGFKNFNAETTNQIVKNIAEEFLSDLSYISIEKDVEYDLEVLNIASKYKGNFELAWARNHLLNDLNLALFEHYLASERDQLDFDLQHTNPILMLKEVSEKMESY